MNHRARELTTGTLILIVLGITVLLVIILGFTMGWSELWKKVNIFADEDAPGAEGRDLPAVQEGIFDDDRMYDTHLRIEVYNENGRPNTKDCYDVYYQPSNATTNEFAWRYYRMDREPPYPLLDPPAYEIWSGQSGVSGEMRIYRGSEDDQLFVQFYDGYNKTFEFDAPYFESVLVIMKNQTQTPVYDCYFDGELVAKNQTYEQLTELLCDDYRRVCRL